MYVNKQLTFFRFADSHNMPLFETSAKDDEKCDHVEAIFMTLAHKINANKLLFQNRNVTDESHETSLSHSNDATVQVGTSPEQDEDEGSCCF